MSLIVKNRFIKEDIIDEQGNKIGELKKESNHYYSQEFEVHNGAEMESYEITNIKNFPTGSFSVDMNNNKRTGFDPMEFDF